VEQAPAAADAVAPEWYFTPSKQARACEALGKKLLVLRRGGRTEVGIACNSSGAGGLIKAKKISRPLTRTADPKPFY
jgi:hypothetical protein